MLKTPMSCTVAASKKIWFMAINLPEHGQRVVGSSLKRVELRPASSRQILCVSEPMLGMNSHNCVSRQELCQCLYVNTEGVRRQTSPVHQWLIKALTPS